MPRSLPILDEALFDRGEREDPSGFPPEFVDGEASPRVSRTRERSPLADRAVAVLDHGGELARDAASSSLLKYEAREGQLQMARAVAEAIDREEVLVCEAGTGTGKTLAYLVPALLSGKRIVVSTATKALQEQVFTKDLPLLQRALPGTVDAVMMKGLANYVCRRRLAEARLANVSAIAAGASNAVDDARLLDRIEAWAGQSETGDRAELAWMRDDAPVWRDVQSGSDTRIGPPCVHHDRCFVTKVRADAQRARLVVVNHHLYLADLALRRGGARQGVIPPHDVVVFDEAHQLEDVATEFFGVRVSSARLDAIVRDGRRSFLSCSIKDDGVERALRRLELANTSFFQAIALSSRITGEARIPLLDDAWTDDARDRLAALDAALETLLLVGKSHERDHEEIAALGRRAQSTRDELARVAAPSRDEVPWIAMRVRTVAVGVSPIDLAPVFRDEVFAERPDRPRAIVLTSATLTAAGSFVHVRRRLGIPHAGQVRELSVASPFDFRKNAGVYAPVDLPEPNDPAFLERAIARILELVRASAGGAFVLCASTRNMRAIHAALREADLAYPLLCQGDAPKISLLERFRAEGNAVLVATMGFWEGVDVPGRSLRLVVIDKLPFAVPTDPVVAARHRAIEETGRSSFAELSVPEVAISLKQGFGRLIRTRDDSGVVAILDRRIRTKGYGRVLRASLPPASPLHTLDEVRTFFDVVVGVPRAV